MLAGTENATDKANIVMGGARDFDFSMRIKRERAFAGPGKGYNIFGVIETIYLEPDRDCRMDPEDAKGVGRRLYWPDGGPAIARSIPEQDLLIPGGLPLRQGVVYMPDVPDINHPVKNPYKVDRHAQSRLAKGEAPREAPMRKQRLENIASSKFQNFLVFQPVAQIVILTIGGGPARFGAMGSYKMPISSLSSFDGTKMALLIDPFTGECFFKGGRYDLADQMTVRD